MLHVILSYTKFKNFRSLKLAHLLPTTPEAMPVQQYNHLTKPLPQPNKILM
jgi:hypothetical protein